VIDERLTITCGAGALRCDLLQRAGRSPLAAGEFLRGCAVPAGSLVA
jgi:methionyl-tRNA formyltransferase